MLIVVHEIYLDSMPRRSSFIGFRISSCIWYLHNHEYKKLELRNKRGERRAGNKSK